MYNKKSSWNKCGDEMESVTEYRNWSRVYYISFRERFSFYISFSFSWRCFFSPARRSCVRFQLSSAWQYSQRDLLTGERQVYEHCNYVYGRFDSIIRIHVTWTDFKLFAKRNDMLSFILYLNVFSRKCFPARKCSQMERNLLSPTTM